jgi:hypothetical protein
MTTARRPFSMALLAAILVASVAGIPPALASIGRAWPRPGATKLATVPVSAPRMASPPGVIPGSVSLFRHDRSRMRF